MRCVRISGFERSGTRSAGSQFPGWAAATGWATLLLLVCSACAPESPRSDAADGPAGEVALLAELSDRYLPRIGWTLSSPVKGRFMDQDRFVVILDRHSPHLHLFSADGDRLWSGGAEGDGPGELRLDVGGYALGTAGRQVVVAQRGRLSLWTLEADSLALDRTVRLPASYAPQGLVEGCDDDWLFYGRDESGVRIPDDSWITVEAPELPFLHRLRIESDTVLLDPLWSDDPELIGWQVGHQGALLGRRGEHVVAHHRPFMYSGHGRFLELDCRGSLLRSVDELALVTGDPYPVVAPRPRAQGTLGIVSLEGGFVTATRRSFSTRSYDIEEFTTQTEIFRFQDGTFQGSVLIPGQWRLLDRDSAGHLLMAQRNPEPHFIRIPVDSLLPDSSGSDHEGL